jgi:hypothetical protein
MLPWLKVLSASCTTFGIFHFTVSVLVPDFTLRMSNKMAESSVLWQWYLGMKRSNTTWCVFVGISLLLWMEAQFLDFLNIRHWTCHSAVRWESLIMLCMIHMGQPCYERMHCQVASKTFHVVCPSLYSKCYFCLCNRIRAVLLVHELCYLFIVVVQLNSIVCGISYSCICYLNVSNDGEKQH